MPSLRPAPVETPLMVALLGVGYPFAMTGVGQLLSSGLSPTAAR